jgi:inhibitor of cysteine peptidase
MHVLRRVLLVASLAAILFAVAGCGASTGKAARLTEANNGEQVEVAIGTEFVVDLEENASTGYSWQVAALPSVLTSVSDVPEPATTPGVVGAAGRRVLTWKAAKSGTGDLKLVYSRPWESTPPAKTFTVTVVVP